MTKDIFVQRFVAQQTKLTHPNDDQQQGNSNNSKMSNTESLV